MVVKENELMVIPWMALFKEKLVVEDNINLPLNGISVYGCVACDSSGQTPDKKVNFEIKVINGKTIIYPLDEYETYLLHGERLVKATTVKIKASDYVSKVEQNGDFAFVLNGGDQK